MADGKKGHKVGRKANHCKAYRASNTREKNRARRMAKYLRKHPEDKQCATSLRRIVANHSILWKPYKQYAP